MSETEIKLFKLLKGFWNYFSVISVTLNMLENIDELKLFQPITTFPRLNVHSFCECCGSCWFQPYMTASSSALWSSYSLPLNFVSGHVSRMWFTVCRWPQSQEDDWARPICADLHCPETVKQRPCVTREIETWLSDNDTQLLPMSDLRAWTNFYIENAIIMPNSCLSEHKDDVNLKQKYMQQLWLTASDAHALK